MEDILIGTTDRSVLVFIPDPASTTGAGKTGLAAAAITVTHTRVETDNDVVHADVTSSLSDLSALTDAHTDWGWKEVSATLSKGLYRLDIADAVFATGAWYAVVQVTITSGTAAATPKAFRLVARNDLDGVRLGLTALPNAAADAAGGLPISDAGGLDLDAILAAVASGTHGNAALKTLIDAIEAALPSDPADQSVLAGLIAAVQTSADEAARPGDAMDLVADAVDPVAIAATGAAEIADAVHDEVYEGTETLRQVLRLIRAALAGKASGLDTNAPKYRDIADSKDRIIATTDDDGNRSAVTTDVT